MTKNSRAAGAGNTTEMAATRAEARRIGAPRYAATVPCPQGHLTFRYTCGGGCGECARLNARERMQKPDPAARKATNERWNGSSKAVIAKQLWRERDPKNAWACGAVGQAKTRARAVGLEFDIDKDYIASILPDVCPVFGTPFVWYGKKISELSPTLDRLIPALGYVKGNIAVISMKANAIKSNATAAEVEAVAAWMRRTIRADMPRSAPPCPSPNRSLLSPAAFPRSRRPPTTSR
jgi:hypothetical protein